MAYRVGYLSSHEIQASSVCDFLQARLDPNKSAKNLPRLTALGSGFLAGLAGTHPDVLRADDIPKNLEEFDVYCRHGCDFHADRIFKEAQALIQTDAVQAIFAADSYAAHYAKLGRDAIPSTVPIVLGIAGDPTLEGFTNNPTVPNKHTTGMDDISWELGERWWCALLTIVTQRFLNPRIAILGTKSHPGVFNPGDPTKCLHGKTVAAKPAGFPVPVDLWININSTGTAPCHKDHDVPKQLEKAWNDATQGGQQIHGVIVLPDPFVAYHRDTIVDFFTTKKKVATIYDQRDFVEQGGLLSYGHSRHKTAWWAVENYVKELAIGKLPYMLPLGGPPSLDFEFAINVTTYTGIGYTLPVPSFSSCKYLPPSPTPHP